MCETSVRLICVKNPFVRVSAAPSDSPNRILSCTLLRTPLTLHTFIASGWERSAGRERERETESAAGSGPFRRGAGHSRAGPVRVGPERHRVQRRSATTRCTVPCSSHCTQIHWTVVHSAANCTSALASPAPECGRCGSAVHRSPLISRSHSHSAAGRTRRTEGQSPHSHRTPASPYGLIKAALPTISCGN